MTKTKRYLLGGVAGIALLATIAKPAEALLPVIDVPALQEWVQQLESDVRQYALQTQQFFLEQTAGIRQAQQLATQLQQYAQEIQTFLSLAHAPLAALTQLMEQGDLGNSLPVNPQSALNLVQGWRYGSGGFGQLAGLLNQLTGYSGYAYQQNHLFTPTDGSFESQQIMDRANGIAGTQGAMEAAYADDRTHEAALPPLRAQMLQAPTTKDALDMGNQMQSEIAWNVNQLSQQQAIATMAELQRDNLVQRDNERLSCEIEQFINDGPPCPKGVAPAAP
jgi:hypothetical protein